MTTSRHGRRDFGPVQLAAHLGQSPQKRRHLDGLRCRPRLPAGFGPPGQPP
jgi:hypothetical protein